MLSIVDEIEYYYQKFKVKNIVFYDDALFVNPEKHICIILEEVVKRGLECYFHTPNQGSRFKVQGWGCAPELICLAVCQDLIFLKHLIFIA
ncbi:MAG: hypothetical protein AB1567_13135 [bacterium]